MIRVSLDIPARQPRYAASRTLKPDCHAAANFLSLSSVRALSSVRVPAAVPFRNQRQRLPDARGAVASDEGDRARATEAVLLSGAGWASRDSLWRS